MENQVAHREPHNEWVRFENQNLSLITWAWIGMKFHSENVKEIAENEGY